MQPAERPSPDRLSLCLPASLDSVGPVVDEIELFSAAAALTPEAGHRLALLVEEYAANVGMHGASGPAAATFFSLQVEREGAALRLTMKDDGPPFDPLSGPAADIAAPLEQREAGGLGLHLIRRLTLRADYARRQGCNQLDLVLDASGPPAGD